MINDKIFILTDFNPVESTIIPHKLNFSNTRDFNKQTYYLNYIENE